MLKFILAFAVVVVIFIRTISFGAFQWKKQNKIGAFGVFIFALAELLLPFYMLFLRKF